MPPANLYPRVSRLLLPIERVTIGGVCSPEERTMPQQLTSFWDRIRLAAYTFAAGIFLGMILGWMFHGFVSTLLWIIFVLLLLVPFVAAVLFWRRISSKRDDPGRTATIVPYREVERPGPPREP